MCVIVDANRMGDFLSRPMRPDSEPIDRWLRRRRGKLVYSTGGRFTREMSYVKKRQFLDYVRAGYTLLVPSDTFAEDERSLREGGSLESDDAHVLALARESGARLLYTHDSPLMRDFKDKGIIDAPRGKIYSGAQNAGLLSSKICAQ